MGTETDREIQKLWYAGLFPGSADYFTQLIIFPGSNAHVPWAEEGTFTLSGRIHCGAKQQIEVAAKQCTAEGHLSLDFESPVKSSGVKDARGIVVLELERTTNVPVEIYLSHIHRKTGVYFAYPALAFMGDVLYPGNHVDRMENAMFWPGFSSWKDVGYYLVVVNPYRTQMSVEIVLWSNDHGRHLAPVCKIPGGDAKWLPLEELMPEGWREGAPEAASLCVTGQFKLVAYMVMYHRRTGVISSADHLHPYHLY